MRPIRWWACVAAAVTALAFGLPTFIALNASGKMPAALRDNPWPMELLAAAATAAAILLAVRSYRQKRARIVATVSAAVAVLGTAVFLLLVHRLSYDLPPAPAELAVGTSAPDFVLPDAAGKPVALASMRGHPVLLVFFRGVW